jgi:enoyl-CoA hydratase
MTARLAYPQVIMATIHETATLPESEAFAIEMKHGMAAMSSEDVAGGPRAFLEKRKPNFRGR